MKSLTHPLLFVAGILAGAFVVPYLIQLFVIATREPVDYVHRCDGDLIRWETTPAIRLNRARNA